TTNLFWLAPQAYFVLTGGSQVTIESQINQLSTKEVTIQNQAYENWRDFLLLRGYWFAGQDYNSTEDSEAPIAFMETWLAESSGTVFGYIFALLMMTGVVYLLIYRRDYRGVGVVLGLLAMWGLMLVNHLDSPLVGQIFRSPFTKAIVPISLLYSLLVGASFLFLARVIRPKFLLFAFGCYVMSLGIYSVPSFGGHFIYHNLRPIVPSDYEQLFAFMHTQPEASRTALLPAETAYGWQHTTWGYRGIGFYWFGMRQAMLNRTFDVWSLDDEEFYHEIHYARLENDPKLFAQVLAKYDVRYLIYDRSIHRRGRNSESFYQQWQTLLSPQCPLIHQSDLIQVYDCGSHSDHYLQAPKNYFVSNTSQTHQFYDPRIALTRHYVTGSESETIDSPFAFLFQREPGREHFTYREASAGAHVIEVTADLPGQDYQELVLPSLVDASRSSFLISLQHEDQEQYLMTISPLFDLYINEKKQEAYQPLELLLPALETTGEVYFDFGTDYTLLTPDVATGSAIVSLGEFGHTQSWRYFPAGRARTQGRNINVSLQDTVELEIPREIWDFWREPEPISLREPLTSLRAQVTTLPIYLRSFATQDAVNCDVIYRGQVDRQPYGEHGYDYQVSNHGSYCDTFYDVHLDSVKHSFWLRADSQNLQGMPLTYYSWDINAQVQSWETLLPAGEVTQTFSFPRTLADEKTAFFDVHTANRSIAGEPTHNILEQNIAYVVPTRELAGITLRGSAASDSQLNPVRIQEVKKSGTSQYQAQISLQGAGEGLLVLAQGYHQGWQAKIKDQLLPHERFDDWANAWKIDPALCPDTCEVEISFWPQWLGWLGLAISIALGGTCGVALGWLAWRHYHFGEHPTSLKQTFAGHKREPATTPDTPTAAVSRL
ncbi:hypothetical protein IJJ08_01865, partial [bacterium]|nr:hypothetical protein [bacterium]